jgi:hypothetical protein
MAIIKNTVRLGLITALAGGAVVVVAGPQRCMAVLMQAKQHVNHVIDENIDDPIALRSQLRNLEAKYPARINEVEKDLFNIQAERIGIEREFAIDQKAIEITQGKLGSLKGYLADGEAAQSPGKLVRITFERDRMYMDEGYRLASHYDTLLTNFEASAQENDLYLDMLIDQENQLADLLGDLEAEQQEFQAQLAQLDRQVDAIARNERLITMLEERQASFNKYDNPYTAPNSDSVKTKIARLLAEQERRIAALQDKGQLEDIRVRAERELQINREVRKSFQSHGFQRPTIELQPDVIEIGPDDEESFETEIEIASRGG